MFDAKDLARVIELQGKSYQLLLWLNGSLRQGRRSFSSIGPALTFSEAAREWLKRHGPNIPEEFRPSPGDLESYSHLFASYLTTSFEVVDREKVRACPGCWCCTYWINTRHLRVRNPDRKARDAAREMKIILLRQLAQESGSTRSDAELREFLKDQTDLKTDIARAAYASELLRRSKFASQGEGVLALWREVAWDEHGKLKRKFKLEPAAILESEARIRRRFAETAKG